MLVAFALLASPALADKKAEKTAKDALTKAEDDYLVTAFDKALRRLQVAERGCGETGCTAETHAALARDIGVMQLRLGQRDAALASFRRAKKLDPNVALNPSYDAADLREAWNAAAPTPQPAAGGDFVHTPPAEASPITPLAIYAEPTVDEPLATVVVRYKAPGTSIFRRAPLKPIGKGFGGYIPCADVTLGTVVYYIQGFDKSGELVASSGTPKNPFSVVVKETATVAALPGQKPPERCGEEDTEKLDLLEGERCQEDRQCKSNQCTNGHCAAPTQPDQNDTGPRDWARFWIGIAGSVDFMTLPSKNEVCIAPQSQYFCTTPGGDDYPSSGSGANQLVAGRAGAAQGQISPGTAHVLIVADYAATPNVLIGARLGWVANSYPGSSAKTIGAPLHVELRGTYVFGDEPLTKTGLAAYTFFGAGVARWDSSQTVNVGEKSPDGRVVPGDRAVQAWLVAGPAFASIGGGARYQFSQRVAAHAGIVLTAAAFPSTFDFVAAPEMQLQYGF
jgi:hypothetical protein